MVATAPKLWPQSTVVCIASGPSLTPGDCDLVREAHLDGTVKVIVINTSYQLAPWADCLYACDARWWKWHDGAKDFRGLKYSLNPHVDPPAQARYSLPCDYGVTVLKNTGTTGLEVDPTGLRTGHNSGYQAINLAVHLGAKKIVLLGYDLKRAPDGKVHWHGDHRQATSVPLSLFLPTFQTLVKPLRALGIAIENCSRESALTCFPRVSLREALSARAPAAALEMSL